MTSSTNIGIIIPPSHRQAIIDKTALFVAKHGLQYQEEILNKPQAKNASTFTFLLEEDPYHAYYLAKIEELRAQQQNPQIKTTNQTESTTVQPSPSSENLADNKKSVSAEPLLRASSLIEALKSSSKKKGQEPPAFEFSLEIPLDATKSEIELIKLTAQFAATDGKKFEMDLHHKEKQNTLEFGFLFPYHPHHSYYTELVRSYKKIIDGAISSWVSELAKNESILLDRAVHRFDFRREEAIKRIESDEKKALERAAFLEIDWHDFVVVETISFNENDELNDSLKEERTEMDRLVLEAANATRRAIEEGSDEVGIEVRKDYHFEPLRPTLSVPMVTLADGRRIPASEMNQAMKTELLDPRWRELQEKFEKRQRDSNLVEPSSVSKNLAKLAGARPDVFGGEIEDAERRLEDQRKREAERIVWDGNAMTADSVKAAIAATSLNPSIPSIFTSINPVVPQPPPMIVAPLPTTAIPNEPPMKKTEDVQPSKKVKFSASEGESVFIINVPSGGSVNPTDIEVSLPTIKTVHDLKELISSQLQNVAVSKFQLKIPNGRFLKNTDALASIEGENLELKWKSR